jgi:antitoxin component of MazEF toxin-antitoxin module
MTTKQTETLEFASVVSLQGMGERQGQVIRSRYPTAFLNHLGVKNGDELVVTVKGKDIVGLRLVKGGGAKKAKAASKAQAKTAKAAAKKAPAKKAATKKKAAKTAKGPLPKPGEAKRKTKVRFTVPAE